MVAIHPDALYERVRHAVPQVEWTTSFADDAAIVKSVIALAHSLRLRVIAEGVETNEQLAYLRMLGCDQYQGYLSSRPLLAADFERTLRLSIDLRQAA